jgi:hypothetical protein
LTATAALGEKGISVAAAARSMRVPITGILSALGFYLHGEAAKTLPD